MCEENVKTDVVEVVEDNTQTSLMKKTKTQLVNIILRKDEVERGLRDDIKHKNKAINELSSRYESFEHRFATLEHDYHEVCDESISTSIEIAISKRKLKIGLFASLMVNLCFILYILIS